MKQRMKKLNKKFKFFLKFSKYWNIFSSGIYQCLATNKYGTALSNKVNFSLAGDIHVLIY